MKIKIIDWHDKGNLKEKTTLFLIPDSWNDYGFYTLFELVYVDESSESHKIGYVKIGHFGQEVGMKRTLSIEDTYQNLDPTFFSVGQSDSYYANLNELGPSTRNLILRSLNDIAKYSKLYDRAIVEKVTKISLLREISPTTVTGQYRRIARGGVRLTDYKFEFISPSIKKDSAVFKLSFDVVPESFPPSNIHVLIGRNGVGKTLLINNMINALVDDNNYMNEFGEFISETTEDSSKLFANLISVSFSAFDESEPKQEEMDKTKGVHYSYIGLKQIQIGKDKKTELKSARMLSNEFFKSLNLCKGSSKINLWIMAIDMLESDPNFREAEIMSLIGDKEGAETRLADYKKYKELSSGHKIVLLTITRIIETLQERSLVLIDEPEAHLHPPLLSAFIRTLSKLLITTNGVAIIGTHSPVVLQEVPRSCVWKLRRTGTQAIAERPEIESFGGNVGVLTNEVFGLEVTDSGFYKLIKEVAEEKDKVEDVINHFSDQLGMEARAILMSIYANKKS